MTETSAALAKLAGVHKAVQAMLNVDSGKGSYLPTQNYLVESVAHYFTAASRSLALLRRDLPRLYEDFAEFPTTPQQQMNVMTAGAEPELRYSRSQLERLARDIDQIFEVRANSELASPAPISPGKRRVFISHGRAPDWREVQSYIEKDINLPTLELAQEANQGMTILAKLWEASEQCDSAVIVMTGDDTDAAGQARARENVIHEIGFFQGKYGLARLCLLHEEGVSIPSNIHGLVYTPFPKGTISASLGLLHRELRAMYK